MENARICIIEPDEIERELIVGIVSGEHEVETFDDGQSLLSSLTPNCPTLVILETQLPDSTGYDVCKTIKSDYSQCVTCVVFLSAKTSVDERLRGLESGADDYINKPYDVLEISAKVRSSMDLLKSKVELKSQLDYASQTAFQAMSAQSEMGIVLKGVQGVINSDTFDALTASVFDCLMQFGLASTLYYEVSEEPVFQASPGRSCSKLEQDIISLVRKKQRIWSKDQRCVFTFGDTSLLILNMPEDEEKAGRLRDSLCFLMESFDVKTDALNKQVALVNAENWQKSVKDITLILNKVSAELQDNVKANQATITNMMNDMDLLLPTLGLEEDQENHINHILDSSTEQFNTRLEQTESTSKSFKAVMAKLKAMQQQ